MRLFGRSLASRDVVGGTDQVLVGYPLPTNGVLNNVHLEVHVIGPDGTNFQAMGMYGLDGFVIPVLDPDSGASFQTIWDQMVPKDKNFVTGDFDIDTEAADTTPLFEIGTPNLSGIVNMAAGNVQRIFKRRKYMSLANGAFYTPDTAGTDARVAVDHFTTQVRKSVRVPSPSVVLFGLSLPDTLQTTTTEPTIPAEAEWLLLMYLEVVLEQAFMSLAGLTEPGSESPYEESMAFIAELVEDSVFEATAGSFVGNTYRVFTIATFDISVPGKVSVNAVSGEY